MSININTMEAELLYSLLNMKLRNDYSSLQILCSSEEIHQKTLEKKLLAAGYEYSEGQNQFRPN